MRCCSRFFTRSRESYDLSAFGGVTGTLKSKSGTDEFKPSKPTPQPPTPQLPTPQPPTPQLPTPQPPTPQPPTPQLPTPQLPTPQLPTPQPPTQKPIVTKPIAPKTPTPKLQRDPSPEKITTTIEPKQSSEKTPIGNGEVQISSNASDITDGENSSNSTKIKSTEFHQHKSSASSQKHQISHKGGATQSSKTVRAPSPPPIGLTTTTPIGTAPASPTSNDLLNNPQKKPLPSIPTPSNENSRSPSPDFTNSNNTQRAIEDELQQQHLEDTTEKPTPVTRNQLKKTAFIMAAEEVEEFLEEERVNITAAENINETTLPPAPPPKSPDNVTRKISRSPSPEDKNKKSHTSSSSSSSLSSPSPSPSPSPPPPNIKQSGSLEISHHEKPKQEILSPPLTSFEEPTIELDPPVTDDNARKKGVISEKTEEKPAAMAVDINDKDETLQKLIKDAIIANDFLNNMMDENRLQAVMLAMKAETLEPNSYIINEGDTGSHFFVSAEGEFEVIKDNKIIKKFGPGIVFGELAILYKAKRFASIKVTTKAKIWSLERKVFQRIMMSSGRLEREENIKFLKSVSLLKDLPTNLLNQIADLLKREFHATGSAIITQGDPGDKFYIIRGGSVTVIKRDVAGNERVVGVLNRGDYFGELALLSRDNRLASIIANEPGTECLALDRISFQNHLGDLEELRTKVHVDIPGEIINTVSSPISQEYAHIKFKDLVVIGTLGVGGFGRVELVQYKKKDTFALKYLKKVEMVQQQQQEHAYSEKDIMATCDSNFIVKLYNTYRDTKYVYFLMEPCLGGDVWTILQKYKYFDERISKFMVACVVEAFEYLHTRHMIYRDLKPENLMLDKKGYVKLVDFGFAKKISPTHKTWTFAGTPEYVAPEIILNKGHDRAVDYWALGVFIHELLVGKPPFRGKDHMKTYNMILRGIDVIQMPVRIPKRAQVLIKRLCRQMPTERLGYQRDGIAEIKRHQWFSDFDYQKLRNQTMTAPLIRPVKSDIDMSNFDYFPRDKDDPPDETSGWDKFF